MILICVIALVILLLLAILLLLPLKVRFRYQRKNNHDLIRLEMAIWKLPPFKFKISSVDAKTEKSGFNIKFSGGTKRSGFLVRRIVTWLIGVPGKKDNLKNLDSAISLPFDWNKLRKKIKRMRDLYDRFSPAAKFLFQHVHCRRFKWSTKFGTGDAAATGIATGIAWMFKTNMLTYIFKYVIPPNEQPYLNVEPNFDQTEFHTDLDCLFEVKNFWLFVTGLKVVIPHKKG